MSQLSISTMNIQFPGGRKGAARRGAGDGASPSPTLHILLVDDEPLVRGGTAEMLSFAGHVVTEAASGEEALDILAADSSIALLITDNRMPGISGATLISRVRQSTPALPILLISGDPERQEGIAPDVVLLSKPFREAGLLAALTNLASGNR